MNNKISFAFPNMKPLSLNGLYKTIKVKGRTRRAKSEKGVEYEKRIVLALLNRRFEINKFETETSIHESFLMCKIVCEMPRTKLIIKKTGAISQTSIDIDNICKPLLDSIFTFFNKLDDSCLCHLDVSKRISPNTEYNVYVEFTRRDIEELEDL